MNISYLCIYLHLQFFINILQFSAHIHFIFVKLAEMDRDHAYFRRHHKEGYRSKLSPGIKEMNEMLLIFMGLT